MDSIETIEVDGLTVKIYQDEDIESPRKECDNFGKMACWHSRYNLGDEQPSENPPAPFRVPGTAGKWALSMPRPK